MAAVVVVVEVVEEEVEHSTVGEEELSCHTGEIS